MHHKTTELPPNKQEILIDMKNIDRCKKL